MPLGSVLGFLWFMNDLLHNLNCQITSFTGDTDIKYLTIKKLYGKKFQVGVGSFTKINISQKCYIKFIHRKYRVYSTT